MRKGYQAEKLENEGKFKDKILKLELELSNKENLVRQNAEFKLISENLEKELGQLKLKLQGKDTKIKTLEELIHKKDDQVKRLLVQIKENTDLYTKEIEKRQTE